MEGEGVLRAVSRLVGLQGAGAAGEQAPRVVCPARSLAVLRVAACADMYVTIESVDYVNAIYVIVRRVALSPLKAVITVRQSHMVRGWRGTSGSAYTASPV